MGSRSSFSTLTSARHKLLRLIWNSSSFTVRTEDDQVVYELQRSTPWCADLNSPLFQPKADQRSILSTRLYSGKVTILNGPKCYDRDLHFDIPLVPSIYMTYEDLTRQYVFDYQGHRYCWENARGWSHLRLIRRKTQTMQPEVLALWSPALLRTRGRLYMSDKGQELQDIIVATLCAIKIKF
jgi:hypothetical protein